MFYPQIVQLWVFFLKLKSTARSSECVSNAHWQHTKKMMFCKTYLSLRWEEKQHSECQSINLVNNLVNPSICEMINSHSPSWGNIKTPAWKRLYEHKIESQHKDTFPTSIRSFSLEQTIFSKVKRRQMAVHPAATLKGLKVFIIVSVRQVLGQNDLKLVWDYNLFCSVFVFLQRGDGGAILWQSQAIFQHDVVYLSLKVQ